MTKRIHQRELNEEEQRERAAWQEQWGARMERWEGQAPPAFMVSELHRHSDDCLGDPHKVPFQGVDVLVRTCKRTFAHFPV